LQVEEPIYDLMVRILYSNVFNIIPRRIDLAVNDWIDNSTIGNTNICIGNVAENSPIDPVNLRERYFEGDFSPKKAPQLLDSDVVYRYGQSPEGTGSFRQPRIWLHPISSSHLIYARQVLLSTTAPGKICIIPTSSHRIVNSSQQRRLRRDLGVSS
jgi:hypothetical protein